LRQGEVVRLQIVRTAIGPAKAGGACE
jgi:hypothetical protein